VHAHQKAQPEQEQQKATSSGDPVAAADAARPPPSPSPTAKKGTKKEARKLVAKAPGPAANPPPAAPAPNEGSLPVSVPAQEPVPSAWEAAPFVQTPKPLPATQAEPLALVPPSEPDLDKNGTAEVSAAKPSPASEHPGGGEAVAPAGSASTSSLDASPGPSAPLTKSSKRRAQAQSKMRAQQAQENKGSLAGAPSSDVQASSQGGSIVPVPLQPAVSQAIHSQEQGELNSSMREHSSGTAVGGDTTVITLSEVSQQSQASQEEPPDGSSLRHIQPEISEPCEAAEAAAARAAPSSASRQCQGGTEQQQQQQVTSQQPVAESSPLSGHHPSYSSQAAELSQQEPGDDAGHNPGDIDLEGAVHGDLSQLNRVQVGCLRCCLCCNACFCLCLYL